MAPQAKSWLLATPWPCVLRHWPPCSSSGVCSPGMSRWQLCEQDQPVEGKHAWVPVPRLHRRPIQGCHPTCPSPALPSGGRWVPLAPLGSQGELELLSWAPSGGAAAQRPRSGMSGGRWGERHGLMGPGWAWKERWVLVKGGKTFSWGDVVGSSPWPGWTRRGHGCS